MRISENSSIILDPPVDINGGAITTPYTNMAEGKDLTVMIVTGAIAANASAAVTLNQASDAAGTGSKTLSYAGYYTVTTVAGADVPTYTAGALSIRDADDNKVFLIEVDASQLDVQNDFDHVEAAVADPGQSTILGVVSVLTNKRDVTASASS